MKTFYKSSLTFTGILLLTTSSLCLPQTVEANEEYSATEKWSTGWYPEHRFCDRHSPIKITAIHENGAQVELEDGSIWNVPHQYADKVQTWLDEHIVLFP